MRSPKTSIEPMIRRRASSAVRRQPVRWLTPALLGLMFWGIAGCGGQAPQGGGSGSGRITPPPTRVLVDTATREAQSQDVTAVGSLRSPETTTVASDIPGIIVELDAPEGREVARGHVVAQLDDAEARAALQVAQARFDNAEIAVGRARSLVADGVTAQQALDDAVAEQRTAAGLLEEAKTRLDKTRIKAPFSGRVGIQTAQLGQFVSSGDPIVQLTQVDPLELVFTIPEEQASLVRLGQRVDARVGRCGEAFAATVEALDPTVDPATRTLAVQARVDNSARRLIPGMSARLRLVTEQGGVAVLSIPREALVAQGSGYLVWVVNEGVTEVRPVTAGRFFPERVEIIDGLRDGEVVVAAGHQKVRPGAPVATEPWRPTRNPNLRLGSRLEDDCGAVTEEFSPEPLSRPLTG